MVIKEQFVGPSEETQLVESLLYRHEDLSLDLQYPYKKLSVVMCPCNPMARNMRTGQSLSSMALALLAELMSSFLNERPFLRKIRCRMNEKNK